MYNILQKISICCTFLPFVLSIVRFRTLSKSLRVLFVYFAAAVITEVLCILFRGLSRDETLTLELRQSYTRAYLVTQNIYTIVECLFLLLVYRIELVEMTLRKVISIVIMVYLSFAAVYVVMTGTFHFPDALSIVESFVMMALAIYFFYKLLTEVKEPRIVDYPFFWFNCAVLIYFSTSLLLFLCGDYIDHCNLKEFERIWSLHLVGNILYNGLLTIGIWKSR